MKFRLRVYGLGVFGLGRGGENRLADESRRENTVLRAEIEPERVSVIPNALLSEGFTPDPEKASKEHSES